VTRLPIAALAAALLAAVPAAAAPADDFLAALRPLCGKAFAGRIVTEEAADSQFAGKPLVMHVRECGPDGVRIPFHVGDDRSRTWVLTRTAAGLRLKHDHRHQDGSEDRMTQYGGDTAAPGTAARQEFPADAHSREIFLRDGLKAAVDNVWAVEVHPGRIAAYELRRPNRHFRVEFDLTRPVEPPPPPWGAE